MMNANFICSRLDNISNINFAGVYFPPEDSLYTDASSFASMLIDLFTCKVTLYVAGDFNCRPGDLNVLD